MTATVQNELETDVQVSLDDCARVVLRGWLDAQTAVACWNLLERKLRMAKITTLEMDAPAEELLALVRGWLRKYGGFSAVAEPGSALKPDTLVEITVSQLFGDFRRPGRPAAVLTMRFVFLDAPNGVAGAALFQREYSRSILLSAPTAASLMKNWNHALTEILAEVASDLRRSEIGEPTR